MEKTTDIAIIGSGLAAYAAALELKDSGKEVAVVTKAPGGTALSSGAWDIVDSPGVAPQEDWAEDPPLSSLLQRILRRQEFHPYSICAQGLGEEGFIDFLQDCVRRAAESLPLSLSRLGEYNRFMLNDMGNYKATALVQASMVGADLKNLDQAKVLVAGIAGFPQFNARFIRESLVEIKEIQDHSRLDLVGWWELPLSEAPVPVSLHSIELAHYFDQEEFFGRFCQELVRYLDGKVYTHLFLPPILGLENTASILEALRKITGLSVAETLATPMSVPGWRLSEAIHQFLRKEGVEIFSGEVVGYDAEQGKVKSLRIHDEDERIRLNAGAVILATGKYLGGGVTRHRSFKEPIFNLPLFNGRKRLTDQSLMDLSARHSEEKQDFLSVGVSVNSRAQALDEDARPLFDNLFAAGSVLGSFDPSHERSAAGVSLVSGTIAARSALSLV